jgi:hypothetical protein
VKPAFDLPIESLGLVYELGNQCPHDDSKKSMSLGFNIQFLSDSSTAAQTSPILNIRYLGHSLSGIPIIIIFGFTSRAPSAVMAFGNFPRYTRHKIVNVILIPNRHLLDMVCGLYILHLALPCPRSLMLTGFEGNLSRYSNILILWILTATPLFFCKERLPSLQKQSHPMKQADQPASSLHSAQ